MKFDNLEFERMQNDPDNYVWGIFYFNRNDKRIIVPKRNRMMGWTVNFANPYGYLILIGIIAVAALLDYMFPR